MHACVVRWQCSSLQRHTGRVYRVAVGVWRSSCVGYTARFSIAVAPSEWYLRVLLACLAEQLMRVTATSLTRVSALSYNVGVADAWSVCAPGLLVEWEH